jgi:hypothetical protein
MDERVLLSSLVAPPFNVAAISATQVDLTWRRVAGATKYLIDEWVNRGWVLIASMGSRATSCGVNSLASNTTYNFRVGVRAVKVIDAPWIEIIDGISSI